MVSHQCSGSAEAPCHHAKSILAKKTLCLFAAHSMCGFTEFLDWSSNLFSCFWKNGSGGNTVLSWRSALGANFSCSLMCKGEAVYSKRAWEEEKVPEVQNYWCWRWPGWCRQKQPRDVGKAWSGTVALPSCGHAERRRLRRCGSPSRQSLAGQLGSAVQHGAGPAQHPWQDGELLVFPKTKSSPEHFKEFFLPGMASVVIF